MLNKLFILTLRGVQHRPTRGWLTILGIVIGIMLVVVILALSSGIQNAVSQQLKMFGSDLVIIFPGKDTNPLVGFLGGQKFRENDLLDLEKIEGVKFVVPMDVAMLNTEFKGEKKSIMVHGAQWEGIKETYQESQGVKLTEGSWPTDNQSREIVLGYHTANNLFRNKVNIGDEITIKSKRMKVMGQVSEIGNQMDDNVIYVSLDMFRNLTGARSGAGSAFLKTTPGANIELVAKQVRHELEKQEVVRDFSILTPEKADQIVGDILSIVELFLVIIAFISLVVGAVGIMNTMYTSVLERTKQIGIMKAIGASNEAILSLFLIESGVIGLIGGVLGTILGLMTAFLLSYTSESFGVYGLFSFASLDYFGIGIVLIITFITGVLSGILPARQAAKMEPAQALRYE